jgi:hypothetical protein
MQNGVSVQVKPVAGIYQHTMDELKDNLWDFVVLGAKMYASTEDDKRFVRDYFSELDRHTTRENTIHFVFPDYGGLTPLSSFLGLHWCEQILTLYFDKFKMLCRNFGYELEKPVITSNSVFTKVKGDLTYAYHNGTSIIIVQDLEGHAEFENLSKKQKEKIELLIEEKKCECSICKKTKSGKVKKFKELEWQTEISEYDAAKTFTLLLKNAEIETDCFIGSRHIRTVPNEIKQCTKLKNLELNNNEITALCDELFDLKLTRLSLNSNRIETLPPSIGRVTTLTTLSLNTNPIDTLPDEICSLQNLENLDLSSTSLRSLPEKIGELTQLETLNLCQTNLSSLPPSFSKLAALKSLYFSNTPALAETIESFPFDVFPELTDITLTNMGLTTIPESLFSCSKLRLIDLDGNRISAIPEKIKNLVSLQVLRLDNNAVQSIDESIYTLQNLTSVTLTDNPVPVDTIERLEALFEKNLPEVKNSGNYYI